MGNLGEPGDFYDPNNFFDPTKKRKKWELPSFPILRREPRERTPPDYSGVQNMAENSPYDSGANTGLVRGGTGNNSYTPPPPPRERTEGSTPTRPRRSFSVPLPSGAAANMTQGSNTATNSQYGTGSGVGGADVGAQKAPVTPPKELTVEFGAGQGVSFTVSSIGSGYKKTNEYRDPETGKVYGPVDPIGSSLVTPALLDVNELPLENESPDYIVGHSTGYRRQRVDRSRIDDQVAAILGTTTERSLNESLLETFQRKHDLPVTDQLDIKTAEKMFEIRDNAIKMREELAANK